MTKYNWKEIPKGFNWAARDKNGDILAFECPPRADTNLGMWVTAGEKVYLGRLPTALDTAILDDWTESVEDRRDPQPRYSLDTRKLGMVHDRVDEAYLSLTGIVNRLNEYEEREQ